MCTVCEKLKKCRNPSPQQQKTLLEELAQTGASKRHQDEVVGQILGMRVQDSYADDENPD